MIRRIAMYEIHGPAVCQVRRAEVVPAPSQQGYLIQVDSKVRYYGATFEWEEALQHIRSWENSRTHVTEIRKVKTYVPKLPVVREKKKKMWDIF